MDTQNSDSLPAPNETTKLAYEGEMERKLKELGKKIDDLIDKADDSKANSIATLKIKKEQAENSLQALKAAGKEAWSELKRGMDSAFDDLHSACTELKTASEKAIAKFNKDRAAGQN